MKISKDLLWKGIIEDLFDDFLHYFFPEWASSEVDFGRAFEFLDKELDAIYPEKSKKKYADKLVKVFLKNGEESWVLVHVEVQGYQDENFAERMFTYFYRIREKHKKNIVSLAIFTDHNPDFYPNQYVYSYLNTKFVYEFGAFKVIHKTLQELQVANNPFSVVMQVVRTSLEKRKWKDADQLTWKKEVITALREANYSTLKIRRMLQFISFYVSFKQEETLINLNEHIETTFKTRKSMGIEEIIKEELKRQRRVLLRKAVKRGLQRGLQQGLEKGVQQGLQQGKMEATIVGIQRMLQQGKYSLSEIAAIFDVSTDFIEQVKNGKLKATSGLSD